MKYVIWKIDVANAQVVQMMPVWFTERHEARAAADSLNEQYPTSKSGFRYVVKEVHTEIIRTTISPFHTPPREEAGMSGEQ